MGELVDELVGHAVYLVLLTRVPREIGKRKNRQRAERVVRLPSATRTECEERRDRQNDDARRKAQTAAGAPRCGAARWARWLDRRHASGGEGLERRAHLPPVGETTPRLLLETARDQRAQSGRDGLGQGRRRGIQDPRGDLERRP